MNAMELNITDGSKVVFEKSKETNPASMVMDFSLKQVGAKGASTVLKTFKMPKYTEEEGVSRLRALGLAEHDDNLYFLYTVSAGLYVDSFKNGTLQGKTSQLGYISSNTHGAAKFVEKDGRLFIEVDFNLNGPRHEIWEDKNKGSFGDWVKQE